MHLQGYKVAFLATKSCESDDVLSVYGGVTLNIQEQISHHFQKLVAGNSESTLTGGLLVQFLSPNRRYQSMVDWLLRH